MPLITCPVAYCITAGVWVPPGCSGCLQHVLASASMRVLCPGHSEAFSQYLSCLSHTAAGALALPRCAWYLQPSFPLVLTSSFSAYGLKWRPGKTPTPPCHTTNAYSLSAPPPARAAVCRLYCRGSVLPPGAVHVQPSQLPDQAVNPAAVPPAVAVQPPAAVLASTACNTCSLQPQQLSGSSSAGSTGGCSVCSMCSLPPGLPSKVTSSASAAAAAAACACAAGVSGAGGCGGAGDSSSSSSNSSSSMGSEVGSSGQGVAAVAEGCATGCLLPSALAGNTQGRQEAGDTPGRQ